MSGTAINDGDLYVNDGETFVGGDYYPDPPEEQQEKEREEKAIKAASYPVNAKLAEWFKNSIEDADDIHNIFIGEIVRGDTKYSRSVSIEAQVLAFQLYKEKLEEKFDEFKDYLEEES